MKHEKILKEIDTQILKNRVRKEFAIDPDILRENNNLLGKLKTVLKNADKEYERGAEDAWELARKIIILDPKDGGYRYSELGEIFGYNLPSLCLDKYKTYKEAIAKVKAYEQKKKEEAEKKKIKIGDVVVNEAWNNPFIVTKIDDFIEGIDETGHMCKFIWPNELIHKMGNAAGVFDKFKMNKED